MASGKRPTERITLLLTRFNANALNGSLRVSAASNNVYPTLHNYESVSFFVTHLRV